LELSIPLQSLKRILFNETKINLLKNKEILQVEFGNPKNFDHWEQSNFKQEI